jgi:hypothetical protein
MSKPGPSKAPTDFVPVVRASDVYKSGREFDRWMAQPLSQSGDDLARLYRKYEESPPASGCFFTDVLPVVRVFAEAAFLWLETMYSVAAEASDRIQIPLERKHDVIAQLLALEIRRCRSLILDAIRRFGLSCNVDTLDLRWMEFDRPFVKAWSRLQARLIDDFLLSLPKADVAEVATARFFSEEADSDVRLDLTNRAPEEAIIRMVAFLQSLAGLYQAQMSARI